MADEKKEVKHTMIRAMQYQSSSASAAAEFKLNPNAPEFFPDPFIQMPTPNYFCQYLKFLNGSSGGMEPDCIYFEDQKPKNFVPELNVKASNLNKNSTDRIQKIVKQSRMVIVENLSEDSSRQHIEKLFSIVGSVKNIRICHPKEHNSTSPSKIDVIISNKLHAFVEFEATVQAAKAVEKLNDESNWRKGLRVRSLDKCMLRSVTKGKMYDHFDLNSEDDQSPFSQKLESPKIKQISENQNGARKACGRGRGKLNGLVQNYNGHGILSKTPQEAQKIGHGLFENNIKQASPRPRMPDGTRGFTMGRGKPLNH
ncbi:la-related protein 6C-like [Dendrobium catenatum]|uniref:RRM domain-containing protein n=1 Tax=Dendrobium catenatum TaxID=906689 RepID=A0A2I0WJR0_9ASPA|nr:la-related protein 6C-like [Dendrobium catenatum]PKU75892.1 hypothetical protein MA16_Dca005939 [Dendrobium catenatum]